MLKGLYETLTDKIYGGPVNQGRRKFLRNAGITAIGAAAIGKGLASQDANAQAPVSGPALYADGKLVSLNGAAGPDVIQGRVKQYALQVEFDEEGNLVAYNVQKETHDMSSNAHARDGSDLERLLRHGDQGAGPSRGHLGDSPNGLYAVNGDNEIYMRRDGFRADELVTTNYKSIIDETTRALSQQFGKDIYQGDVTVTFDGDQILVRSVLHDGGMGGYLVTMTGTADGEEVTLERKSTLPVNFYQDHTHGAIINGTPVSLMTGAPEITGLVAPDLKAAVGTDAPSIDTITDLLTGFGKNEFVLSSERFGNTGDGFLVYTVEFDEPVKRLEMIQSMFCDQPVQGETPGYEITTIPGTGVPPATNTPPGTGVPPATNTPPGTKVPPTSTYVTPKETPGTNPTPTPPRCNQGLGNGSEGCSPGNSDHNQPPNDELPHNTPGNPERGGPNNNGQGPGNNNGKGPGKNGRGRP